MPVLGGFVVGVVEARVFEVYGDGVEDVLNWCVVDFVCCYWVVGDLLYHFEEVFVFAVVLVDRHKFGG